MANVKILQLFLQSLFLKLFFYFQGFALETDTISSALSLKDPDYIVSPGRIFKLGFFSPVNTTNRYLAIYQVANEETVIWVANRGTPLKDSSGTVTISADGNLVLKNAQNVTVWSTNATNVRPNTTTHLQDNGNLVLRDNSTGNVIWESFAHPTNVRVPSMKLIDNTNTGERVVLTSWKNESDPDIGSFTLGFRALDIPQGFIWHNDGRPHWRTGPWNGKYFTGVETPYAIPMNGYVPSLKNESGIFSNTLLGTRFMVKISLNSSGSLEQSLWNDQKNSWDIIWIAPQNDCEVYGKCGPFGFCNWWHSPICSCLRGFEPLNKKEWQNGNWTNGCVRKTQLQCRRSNSTSGHGGKEDGFFRMQYMKVPDFSELFPGGSEEDCRSKCLQSCSCLGYAYDPTIQCMLWRNVLIDTQQLHRRSTERKIQGDPDQQDLYIRLASSELGNHNSKLLIIIIPLLAGFVCISICVFMVWCWMGKKRGVMKRRIHQKTSEAKPTLSTDSTAIFLRDELENVNIEELPLFTFETLANATNHFHDDNMLGKGGFGPVYLGKMENGREIAIKRLSEASAQGAKEFMNELILISKVQHRNLVRLLGCCVEKEEKMLIYEYMPNKSLDVSLFVVGHPSQKILDWKKRFSIIEGIGRGLLYLHKHSRLRIIHRDLKPSNILLDGDWNPKISDFGMARIFGSNEDQANTARVFGTYGYMAPEYAMEGRFSEKSDVYSFGVLILEIVSGKKNTQYYNEEWSLSLLGCAWKIWNENNGMSFIDQVIAIANVLEEIMRCIHIALLCVQELPADRPTIQTVLSMLSPEVKDLPLPEQPEFAEKWNRSHVESTQRISQIGHSINELTVTVLKGR